MDVSGQDLQAQCFFENTLALMAYLNSTIGASVVQDISLHVELSSDPDTAGSTPATTSKAKSVARTVEGIVSSTAIPMY